jgi:6-pyruvoyltetrahydropterin/6-carboxytetrahydropterin synthase
VWHVGVEHKAVAHRQLALGAIDPLVCVVPFNPTAENIARHLVEVVAPEVLAGTGVFLVECEVGETRKCSASFRVPSP